MTWPGAPAPRLQGVTVVFGEKTTFSVRAGGRSLCRVGPVMDDRAPLASSEMCW
jgi:hypothetical protein